MSFDKDRNFDDLAERFASRVYGKLKGKIRQVVLWRDITQQLDRLKVESNKPLRILDVAGGLGFFSVQLALLGHAVHYNDISLEMTKKARLSAAEAGVADKIQWLTCPYQQLPQHWEEPFDLILCHALIEWLASPEKLIPALASMLKPQGHLSLCFYNPAGQIYRNLICGNFRLLNRESGYQSDCGSLTPNNPSELSQVQKWLVETNFEVLQESGIRVFSDYVTEKRGGNQVAEDVLAMELKFSTEVPYKWLGRYLHLLARLQ